MTFYVLGRSIHSGDDEAQLAIYFNSSTTYLLAIIEVG